MSDTKKDKLEEAFDDPLKLLLGGRYHEHIFVEKDAPVAECVKLPEAGKPSFWNRVKAPVMLALADGLMFYMCLGGKIDLPYGLVFLACISAAFGHSLRKPGAYEA